MKTSERIKSLTASVNAAFTASGALTSLLEEHAPEAGTSPASKMAAAVERERVQRCAPDNARRVRDHLKGAVRDARKSFEAIEREGMDADRLADYIESKADTLPPGIPAHLAAAAQSVRGSSEAALTARQLRMAARNVSDEMKRLNANYFKKLSTAVPVVLAKSDLRIYGAAKLAKEVAAADRMVTRARAASEGMRKKIAAARNGEIG